VPKQYPRPMVRAVRRVIVLCPLTLALAACGSVEIPSRSASAAASVSPGAAETPASPTAAASDAASLAPSPTASVAAGLYVNEAGGWSIMLPAEWEVASENGSDAFLIRDDMIAEVLVGPSTGQTLQELEAEKVEHLSTWSGAGNIESDIVRLPAGEAIKVSIKWANEIDSGVFILHMIEKGDRQYAISVRGPEVSAADVEALVQSFVILD
jgi:hypothetical protein